MKNKLCILSSRMEEIGNRCIEYARNNVGSEYELTDSLVDADILISILYDTILTKDELDGKRAYNFHPGILPDYRGAGAYSWVLINKEKETGVTLHEIDYNIDSGPIIEIAKTLIYPQDTAESLFSRCMDLLFSLFSKNFNNILRNEYTTIVNEGGNIFLRRDLEEAKDISHIVKAFTFSGKEGCYYYDDRGIKNYINFTN